MQPDSSTLDGRLNKELLITFFREFDIVAGLLAYEEDALVLFGSEHAWPNESLTVEALRANWKGVLISLCTVAVLTNNKYIQPEITEGAKASEDHVLHFPPQPT